MSHFNYYLNARRFSKSRPEWRVLKACWKGYKIAKAQNDIEKMRYYAEGIRKVKIELGLGEEVFPNLDMWEMETTDEVESNSGTNEDESPAQRAWREKMQDRSTAQRRWQERTEESSGVKY